MSEQSLGDLLWEALRGRGAAVSSSATALVENYDLRIAAARVLDARAQVTITRSFQFPDVTGNASAPYTRIPGDRSPLQAKDDVQPAGDARPLLGARPLGPAAAGHGGGPRRSARRGGGAAVRHHHPDQRRGDRVLPAPRARPRAGDLPADAGLPAGLPAAREAPVRGRRGGDDRRAAGRGAAVHGGGDDSRHRAPDRADGEPDLLAARSEPGRGAAGPRAAGHAGPIPPTVPAGLPSSLLERRPDIRQAEDQLAAATARIGVAKADYFPRVLLTGGRRRGRREPRRDLVRPQRVCSRSRPR